MERLTERLHEGCYGVAACGEHCKYKFTYCLYKEVCPEVNACLDKLGELEDLQEAGRLVELPCAVGDRVFCILHSKNEIVEDVVEDYDIWSIKTGIKLRLSLLNHNDYVVGEFGKTVFLTREEAEAALEGEQDG